MVTKKRRRNRKRKRHCGEDQGTEKIESLSYAPQNRSGVADSKLERRDDQRNGDKADSPLKRQKISKENGFNGANLEPCDQNYEGKEQRNEEILKKMGESTAADAAPSKLQTVYTNCNKGHRAGFDAFMTGFAMASFAARYGSVCSAGNKNKALLSDWRLDELVNKVCLSGKSIPMIITKSSYCKTSKQHAEKRLEMLHSVSQ